MARRYQGGRKIRPSAFSGNAPGHALNDLVRENLSEAEAYPVISDSIVQLQLRQTFARRTWLKTPN